MSFDVRAVREHFPALKAGYAHFDGPGGSQVPDVVAEAVAATMLSPLANRGRVTAAERTAESGLSDGSEDRAGPCERAPPLARRFAACLLFP